MPTSPDEPDARDPYEVRDRRWRLLISVVGGIVLIAAMTVPLVIVLNFSSATTSGTSTLLLRILVGTIVLSAAVGVLGFHRSQRRSAKAQALAKDRDGAVCPYCQGTPALTAEEPRCCRRAPRDWTIEDYREFWSNLSKRPFLAAGMLLGKDDRRSPWRQWMPSAVCFGMLFVGVVQGGMTWWRSGDAVALITSVMPYLLFGYGLDLLIVRGFGGWRRTDSACARCRYPARNIESVPRCPECGHQWRARIGGTSTGHRVRRIPQAILGAILVALGAWPLFIQPGFGTNVVRRFQSSSSLISAADVNGFLPEQTAVWAELGRRSLLAEEESALFDKLLAVRPGSLIISPAPETWMLAYLAKGAATPAQLTKLRRESFPAELSAPSRTRLGADVVIRIVGKRVFELLPPAHGVALVVGGAWFADRPDHVVGRSDVPRFTVEIDSSFGKKPLAPMTLRADALGDREIVVRAWLIARPYGTMANPIRWNDDGTPEIPADALWSEPMEWRHAITVAP